MDWNKHNFLSNFWKLGLRGIERPLHSCLQIYSNSLFFCFNQQLRSYLGDYNWETIFFSPQWCNLKFNDKGSRMSRTHVMNISRTQISYLCSLCTCVQFFHNVYVGEKHKAHVLKVKKKKDKIIYIYIYMKLGLDMTFP